MPVSYGCYITTLPDDRALEEYNAEHPDTPIDIEAFKRGETAIAGKDTRIILLLIQL